MDKGTDQSGEFDRRTEREFFREIGEMVERHRERGGDPAAVAKTMRFYGEEGDRADPLQERHAAKERDRIAGEARAAADLAARQAEAVKRASEPKTLSRPLDWCGPEAIAAARDKQIKRLPPRDKDRGRDR